MTARMDKEFLIAVNDAANFLNNHSELGMIRVFSHFDADGISAAGILSKALSRINKRFHTSILSKLDDNTLLEIAKDQKSWTLLIFSDLGSSKIGKIAEIFQIPVLVLDHHSTLETLIHPRENIFHLNPHLFQGLDGSSEVSGAGVTYLVTKALSNKNVDLARYAIVGALGDRQDKGQDSSLLSINLTILDDAIASGEMLVTKSFWLYGYQTRPLTSVIEKEILKVHQIPLTGKDFLAKCNIPTSQNGQERVLADLTDDELGLLMNKLALDYSIGSENYYRNVYILKNEDKLLRDAKEFSSLLNAVGRQDQPSIGVSLILGDRRRALRLAINKHKEYRNILREYLEWVSDDRLVQMKSITYFDARKKISDKFIGTITSIISSNNDSISRRVLIGIAEAENSDKIKISARVSRELQPTVDISSLMKGLLSEREYLLDDVEYEVGGHDAAAGAIIETSYLQKFLEEVDRKVTELLEGKAA